MNFYGIITNYESLICTWNYFECGTFELTINKNKANTEKLQPDNMIIVNKNDEFEKIGLVFNSMMDEVEESFNLQKQFVQDASHELRTPLTILKGHLQMLSRKYNETLFEESYC